jgi:hypothetical protein
MPEENPRRRRSGLPLIVGALVILLGAAGYWAWMQYGGQFKKEELPQPVVEMPAPEPTTNTYSSSTMRFSVEYPKTFSVQEQYAYTAFKGKPISGVKFVVPPSAGTNLASDSGVSIEQLPRANSCTGDIYLLANVRAQNVTEGATTYSVATSSSVTAGNAFEEMVFAYASSTPCTAIRYFIHTSVGTTSTTTAVTQFDRAALLQEFDAIRESFRMQ